MSIFKKIIIGVTYIVVVSLLFYFLTNDKDETNETDENETIDSEVIPDSPTTPEVESSPVNEATSINKQEVYDFMESEFLRITNDGDTYEPEVHDPMIAEIAAKKFGITAEEATAIQIEVVMNMYK